MSDNDVYSPARAQTPPSPVESLTEEQYASASPPATEQQEIIITKAQKAQIPRHASDPRRQPTLREKPHNLVDVGRFQPRGPRSLYDQSFDILKANMARVYETGATPLHMLRPMVQLVKDPHQLGSIEDSSPHLRGEIPEVWMGFIKRTFPEWQRLLQYMRHPNGPRKGEAFTESELAKVATHRHFLFFQTRERKEEKRDIDALRARFKQSANEERHKKTGIIKGLAPPISKKRGPGDKFGGVSGTVSDGSMRFAGGSRTKTNSAAGVMRKVRREMAEHRLSMPGNTLGTPSHLLSQQARIGVRRGGEMGRPRPASAPITAYRNGIHMAGRSVVIDERNIVRASDNPQPMKRSAADAGLRTAPPLAKRPSPPMARPSPSLARSSPPAKRPSPAAAPAPGSAPAARPKQQSPQKRQPRQKVPYSMFRQVKHHH